MQHRGRLPYLLIPAAALVPVLPLMIFGCSCGHDFAFHILNWLEAARQFTHATYPHWAYTPAYNAGEPRFVFYPPLSWTIGAILGLLFPWTWTPILYTWLILTAAGLALHRLTRSFVGPTPALLAAVFYLTNPYTLFTAYERTAYAELLAAVWIPLLLHAILSQRVTIPRIALPVALLWLTNAPAAVMSCYALALLTLIRLATNPETAASRLKLALTVTAGTLLGLALAAFYLIPAAYERRYVQIQMAILPGLRIQDNFLFHHTTHGVTDLAALADAAAHDTVLHTASLIALLLLTLTAIAIAILRYQTARATNPESPLLPLRSVDSHSQKVLLYTLATLTLTIAFLLTPFSNLIWLHTPELAFLQFPWRLLAILAPILSLTLALTLRTTHLKPATTAAIALAIAAALTYPAYQIFHQPCDPEDTVAARTDLFHSQTGTEPTDEYTPIPADNDALAHTNPPYWLATNPDAPAPTTTQPGPAPTHLALNSPTPQILILNLRDYPSWNITANNTHPNHIPRTDGLLAIPIPAGPSQIDITPAKLPDRILGIIVTLFAAATLLALLLQKRRHPPANVLQSGTNNPFPFIIKT